MMGRGVMMAVCCVRMRVCVIRSVRGVVLRGVVSRACVRVRALP
jgi:hypothetical protein